ncbi:hypothetical protein SDC9_111584 [bioreactor metagenome]|uniref:N-acetyltransferase domain-containing protein n=1 Tax=bioreactor metagenome TaxID=1076179 RepID=A0A645BHQ0_9ZZZZ
MINPKTAALFDGWGKSFIDACLQGHMGVLIEDNPTAPTAARITVGDFCLLAGKPCEKLVLEAKALIVAPRTENWFELIEKIWGSKAEKTWRYAIKKEVDIFDRDKLSTYAAQLPQGFSVKQIDETLYRSVLNNEWSADLCKLFLNAEDYLKRGLGFVVMYGDKPVSGASSYCVYDGGIEIEIDTDPKFRRMGLATACGAKLILACLERGLYPGWDAHDLRSVLLAEKLGYHRDKAYPVYILTD